MRLLISEGDTREGFQGKRHLTPDVLVRQKSTAGGEPTAIAAETGAVLGWSAFLAWGLPSYPTRPEALETASSALVSRKAGRKEGT